MTGVDRVEMAYLTELLRRKTALFGLVRTAAGSLLLDRAGVQGVADLASNGLSGKSDLLSRLTNRRDTQRARAETAVRHLAMDRALAPLLRWLLRRVPQGSSYINVGHSNLSQQNLAALRHRCGIAVLLHDTIPLDHPAFSRPDTIESFRSKIAATATCADLVIHTAHTTRQITEAHLRNAGRLPSGIVARLGVPKPDPGAVPHGLQPTTPYFVILGTVEPRKNHELLVTVWTDLARRGTPPPLLVIGGRGWAQAALFDQLSATPGIYLQSGLSDGAVATLLDGAAALLFPSLAEGFGLPPVEAAALGTPVIASDLPVLREMLRDYPIYLAPTDSNSWLETINRLVSDSTLNARKNSLTPPSWEEHFDIVLNLV